MSEDLPTQASVPSEAAPDGSSLPAGARFGAYRIERQIGRGGMGEVYRARQEAPVLRTVALKLLQQRLRGTLAETLFEVESQALARLRHASIAQVYDAGSADGRPYLAMEWIEGLPMREWAARRNPDRRRRLALLAEVARGAHHAHVNGILHRDLKPDNVMVVSEHGREQPKIIDFGVAVAWLAERHEATSGRTLAERVGTPAYMSPEQREGRVDLDPRSDVYALGMVLLQLLVGDRKEPWPTLDSERCAGWLAGAGAADDERSGWPARTRALPEELRWLIGKALAEDREQRYESALHLAQDLERYLALRPLEAAPPRPLYPLRKFLRRNRAASTLALVAVLALAVGLGVALYGLQQAREQRSQALRAAEQARIEANRAERVAGFLRSILGAVDPDVARGLDKTLLRKVLDAAATRAEEELADDPEVLGSIEHIIGQTYRNLGESELALPLLQRARDKGALRLAEDMRLLTMALDDLGHSEDALAALQAFRAEAVMREGEDSAQVLQLDAEHIEYLLRGPDPTPAVEQAQALLPRLEQRLGPDHDSTLRLMNTLARGLLRQQHAEQALPLLQTLIERRTAAQGDDHPSTVRDRAALVIALLSSGRHAEALPLIQTQLQQSIQIFGAEHPATLSVYSFLGSAHKGLGEHEAAASAFELAYEGFAASYGAEHPNVVGTGFNLANALLLAGQAEAAERRLRALSEAAPKAFGPTHPMVAEVQLALQRSRLAQNRLLGVESALLALYETASAPEAPTVFLLQDLRAALHDYYQRAGQPKRAAEFRPQG